MPTTISPCGGGAAAAAALPWCEAFRADYNPADFFAGRSDDPLRYKFFAGNDATAFKFVVTNIPAAGNGDVQILRSGLYRIELMVSGSAMPSGFAVAYTWDIGVQVRAQDAASNFYFGPGPNPGSAYYSEGSYVIYWNGAPQVPFPNFQSLTGSFAPDPAGVAYLNLDDSVVTWPVTVYNRYNHGLDDADVHARGQYYLRVSREGDSNPAGYTG